MSFTEVLKVEPQLVLDFWFAPSEEGHFPPRPQWFFKSPNFDQEVRERFLSLYEEVRDRKHESWLQTPEGILASVIVLDQFPRNMFREDPRAFATDALAREYSALALNTNADIRLHPVQRWFLYLPYEHSESLVDQEISLGLFSELQKSLPDTQILDYAQRHFEVIRRFGRFPHRNKILDRLSTPEETEFLQQPGSRF